ncbi:hypothetical protein BDV93DRAFT_23675 [Ceratobasidium sp. AG-I]|nr:hypothetical protein BDV93DRAFT_23675 [Ceratobasidium sp. AG-I]
MAEQDPSTVMKDRIIRHMNEDHHASLADYLQYYAKASAKEAATAELVDINTAGMTITRITEPNGPPRPVVIPIDPPMESLKQARERLVAMAYESMEGLGRSRWKIKSFPTPSLAGVIYGVISCTIVTILLNPDSTLRPGANFRRTVLLDSDVVARSLYTYQREIRSIIMGSAVYNASMRVRRRLQRHSYDSGWLVWISWLFAGLIEGPVACVSFDKAIQKAEAEASGKKH